MQTKKKSLAQQLRRRTGMVSKWKGLSRSKRTLEDKGCTAQTRWKRIVRPRSDWRSCSVTWSLSMRWFDWQGMPCTAWRLLRSHRCQRGRRSRAQDLWLKNGLACSGCGRGRRSLNPQRPWFGQSGRPSRSGRGRRWSTAQSGTECRGNNRLWRKFRQGIRLSESREWK